jgi:general secretion pathway protein G
MNRPIFVKRSAGFTIIELLVTVVIIGILSSAILPLAELNAQRAKEQELREALRTLRSAIDAYKQASDEGRVERKADESGYPHSLEELVTGVKDAKDPNGGLLRFLRRIPRDPLSTEATAAWGLRSYASSDEEPKKGSDVYDVYSRAEGRGFNDIPYRKW